MNAAVVGAIATVAAIVFVMWPLYVMPRRARRDARGVQPAANSAVRALREIEFDRATGKLEAADYESLKIAYTARALVELRDARVSNDPAGATAADDAEALISTARSGAVICPRCGAECREADAVFCSGCGASLAAKHD